MSAAITDVFSAATVTSPASAVTSLSVIDALGAAQHEVRVRKTLTATDLPFRPSLRAGFRPGDDAAESVAGIEAASVAVTATSPPAVTVWSAISLETPPRTSLTTMIPPTAVAFGRA